MEHKAKTSSLAEHTQKNKKKYFYNNKHNQVISKFADNQKKKINVSKTHLKMDPSTSSTANIVLSSSNHIYPPSADGFKSSSNCIENSNSISDDLIEKLHSTFTNLTTSKIIKQNDLSDISINTVNMGVCSNENSNKSEVLSPGLENSNEENILKFKNLTQFMKCEDSYALCRFCHCIICNDIITLTEHATKCKTLNETKLSSIRKFNCLVCNKVMKSLKDWKSHAIGTYHIDKCMNKNDYISFDCGGCKTFFFGNKDQILIHCKNIHKDRSGLPCIFKCMKEIFTQFIFRDPGNWTSWTFCGPCKKYSSNKVNCYALNHVKKNTKHFKCDSCLIDFICSQDVYNKHLISCEHIMLEHLRSETDENPESQIISNLKLPPIFLNRFTIKKKVAICNDCKFQMFSNEKSLTLHLTECIYKSDISGKNTTKINKYFCEVCNETTSDFSQWKLHLILSNHFIKCYDSKNLVSYTCELCSLHCYGNSQHVADHQAIHPNDSEKNLSMFLAFNFQRINKDLKSKEFYYCEDCQSYAEVNLNSDHWNKSHKTKLKRMICQPCRTEFFCIEGNDLFVKHILSSEHIVLKYITTKSPHFDLKSSPVSNSKNINVANDEHQKCCGTITKENIKNQNSLIIKSYSNWFQNVEDKNTANCISCNDQIDINETALLCHLLNCDQNSKKCIPMTNINSFRCLECMFNCDDYDNWEKHAISHMKSDTYYGLYSYFCSSCSCLLYGKINDIELHLNNDHKILIDDMPLDTILMAKQLMRKYNNTGKSTDIMCFCEPCKKIFKLIENCKHFNTDSHASIASDLVELFYCKYCEVEFYSSSIVYENHKFTAEHIIMSSEYCKTNINIFKPSKLDSHLLKFVTNQNLYDTTLNIGFFCFICNYLCLSLDVWKTHINGKKHNNSSKGFCMDHRCKICKTLMFGKRQHMFEHYGNHFHSLLRTFKSVNNTGVKKNNPLLQNKLETKYICNIETTSMDSLNAGNDKNILGESTNTINKTLKMKKMFDESLLESNTEQENITGEISICMSEPCLTTITEDKSPCEQITQLNSTLDECTTRLNETHLITKDIVELSFESNTQNYSNFFGLKINMLNELINQNKEIRPKCSYYCVPCDFITAIKVNWEDHNSTDHSNYVEVRHSVFCDICYLYQVGPSNNLNNHINTIEHKNMIDFKHIFDTNNMKKVNDNKEEKNGNKNNLSTDKPSSVAKLDVQEKNNEKEASNRKITIEIKDAKQKYKRNSWVELKKIFSAYGYFAIFPKHNSVIIIFRKLSCVHKMLKDKEKLEKMHEFTICVTFEDEKLPDLDKTTEFEFGNKELLIKNINAQLMAINEEISNPNILHRLQLLINAIHSCAGPPFFASKTYAFGSRMSGLALKDSDVDLYFDIANTFGGDLSNDLYAQEDLVRYFGKAFRSRNNEFKQVQLITGARVPIVKFLHLPSGLNCDLSFKSGLSTHNTKLVRLYLALDERVHWIVCAVVKRWALQNDLKNQSMFTSYALAWLVLFYLMTIDVVPSLKFLRANAKYSEDKSRSDVMFIEDWDCTFCSLDKAKQIWKVPEIPCWDLLYGFFKFYSDSNRLKQFVLCPAIGEAIPREKFINVPMTNPDILGFYKKKTGDAIQRCMKLRDNFHYEGLALQDPFDLFHNITKTIVSRKLQGFSHLCNKTTEVMNNGIQPYYA